MTHSPHRTHSVQGIHVAHGAHVAHCAHGAHGGRSRRQRRMTINRLRKKTVFYCRHFFLVFVEAAKKKSAKVWALFWREGNKIPEGREMNRVAC